AGPAGRPVPRRQPQAAELGEFPEADPAAAATLRPARRQEEGGGSRPVPLRTRALGRRPGLPHARTRLLVRPPRAGYNRRAIPPRPEFLDAQGASISMKRLLLMGLLLGAGLAASRADEKKAKPAPATGQQAACECCCGDESAATHRVYELRTYYTNENKLDDLNKRF